MKKMVSLMLAVVLVLSSVSCFAAAPEASVHEVQNNVFIEGKVDKVIDGEILRLTLEDAQGDPVYIAEYDVDNSGKYVIKFKYTGYMSNLKLNLAYGDELVTDSAVTATATSQIMEADVFVTDTNDKSYEYNIDQTIAPLVFSEAVTSDGYTLKEYTYNSIYNIDARTGLKAVVNIKNKYAYEEEVSIMVAAYDENNKLLDCVIETKEIEYAADGKVQSGETVAISIPDGTVKAKAFCWSSTSNLIALGEQADGTLPKVDIFLFGDSYGSIYGRASYPESGWGMHLGNYFNSKYVTITNNCRSGAWIQSIMGNTNDSRYLDNIANGKEGTTSMHGWNIWNTVMEKDANYGEGDYVIVSLGINDASKTGEDEFGNVISAVDWYGLGLEDMVKRVQQKGANIILCTRMPQPQVTVSANDKLFIEKTKEVSEKYGVPCLDMITNILGQYQTEFGDDVDGVYARYYLDRAALMTPVEEGGFGMTAEELQYHAQTSLRTEGGKNFHPNVRGADTMAYWIAKLLKQTDSDLRFYVR